MKDKIYLNIEEVAKLLSVDYQLVYKLVRQGDIPAVKIGRVYRIERNDLNSYLERQKTRPAVEAWTCEACGREYRSNLSCEGYCAKCHAPICKDCWERLGVRHCKNHGGN